jgi:hypothetical protein
MGWRFRKQVGSGPFRGSITKRGVGISWGIPGFRIGVSPSGRKFLSLSIPGTGLYWIKYFGAEKNAPSSAPPSPILPPVTKTQIPSSQSPTSGTPWWKQPP